MAVTSPIRDGSGLLRCCRRAIIRFAPADPREGDHLDCDHCSGDLRFHLGKWEFDFVSRARRLVVQDMQEQTAERRERMKGLLTDGE